MTLEQLKLVVMHLLSPDAVDEWLSEQRIAGHIVGYTCGAFDIVHAGHVEYLEEARKLCDRLLVAVNTDRSIQLYKSPLRPINSEQDRAQIIGSLRSVDAVTLLDEASPLLQLQRWRPDLYIKGGDYAVGKLRSGSAVRAYGGNVVVIPMSHVVSTSDIIRRIIAIETHECAEAPARSESRIVFVDRDGTIIDDQGYEPDPATVRLLPGVGEALATLQSMGFRVVVVTNQQGIGLGYYSVTEFIRVNQAMFRLLAPFGVKITRILFCPHSLADDCQCRKPGTLLLTRALEIYHAKAKDCYFVGDQLSDMEAGESIRCRFDSSDTAANVDVASALSQLATGPEYHFGKGEWTPINPHA